VIALKHADISTMLQELHSHHSAMDARLAELTKRIGGIRAERASNAGAAQHADL